MLAKSVEHGPRTWDIGSLVPGRVKTVTYKIDTWRFLAWHSILFGEGMQGLVSSVLGLYSRVGYQVIVLEA